jgi:hypothetical protein
MAQSGNRPPRSSGNRPPRSQRATSAGGGGDTSAEEGPTQPTDSANDRARERLAQQSVSGNKGKSASQRARAGGSGGSKGRGKGGSGRGKGGSGGSAPKRSSAVTAGIFGAIFVILVVVVILLVSLVTKNTTSVNNQTSYAAQPASAAVVSAITNVPSAVSAAAGTGAPNASAAAIHVLKGQPLLTSGGKPELVYVGAEYCPYCAATRWGLTEALSRFGTFTNLQQTKSSAYDAYPSTDTLSYYKTAYSSPYLVFNATEQLSNKCAVPIVNGQCANVHYTALEPLSSQNQALLTKYDAVPFVPSNSVGGIPFIYFGGRYVQSGAIMLPSILAGYSWTSIAASTQNPASQVGTAINGSANLFTAAICKMTAGKPGSVCNSAVILKAAAALPQ